MDNETLKSKVRDTYKDVVLNDTIDNKDGIALSLGYSPEDLNSAPDGINLGLSCGNPIEYAELKEGETVLDLGSGAGFDCYLAMKEVGDSRKVIGVDMLVEMIEKARRDLKKYKNIEFRLGEIENLPLADNSVDCIISNCVINLSTNKDRVFKECMRVLKPNGRICVSDIIKYKELPKSILGNADEFCH